MTVSLGTIKINENKVSKKEYDYPSFDEINIGLLHQVVKGSRTNFRNNTASVKTRAQVSGTGAKPFAQKGTGRARQGSLRSPQFIGGGIAHGPKGELAYKKRKLNKTEKKQSVASLITEKNNNKNLLILNDFSSEIKKTKEMNSIINKLEITNSLIILDKNSKEKIEKSVRNIPNVKVTDVNHFSAYDIIKFKKVVFTESSVKELEKRYS